MSVSKKTIYWAVGIAVAVLAVGYIGARLWISHKTKLPDGIASGNGRLEAKLVDIAAKEPLRVKELLVDEGALVRPGQVLVRLDTVTLEAELAEAQAKIAAAIEKLEFSRAGLIKQKAEIELSRIEVGRADNLVHSGAGSQRDLDVRRAKLKTNNAEFSEVEARLNTALKEVEVAQAQAKGIQTRIDDATLVSPVNGRVLYRLAEAGEVLSPGGKAITLVNLEDVYMEIFLPSEQAGTLKVGGEGRITLDYAPKQPIEGYVSFVSPEAQFTPKQVETKSEREKLMFRVKIQVPKEFASRYIERVKTGVRGVGFVKLRPDAQWPEWLRNPAEPEPQASTR